MYMKLRNTQRLWTEERFFVSPAAFNGSKMIICLTSFISYAGFRQLWRTILEMILLVNKFCKPVQSNNYNYRIFIWVSIIISFISNERIVSWNHDNCLDCENLNLKPHCLYFSIVPECVLPIMIFIVTWWTEYMITIITRITSLFSFRA